MNRDQHWLVTEKYEGVESDGFHADCKRLANGEPLGYIIGHVPFLDCQIWLDSHPLIPRPETEFWVEHALREIKKSQLSQLRGLTPNIMDLCAGSGAIGVAVAKAIPEATVTFAEIDPIHLPTIKINLTQNLPDLNIKSIGNNTKLSNRLQSFVNSLGDSATITKSTADSPIDWTKYCILQSDLFENIERQFDFILTNPPYINAKANTVDDSVVANEPHLALFGGKDGLEIIERIIKGARAKLAPPTTSTPGGQLWLEHEPFQTDAIHTLAQQFQFTITTHDDQYHTPRYSVLRMAQY